MTQKLSRAEMKAMTRDALAHATRELIAERGWNEATIEAIAARAGVSERTFFRHFPTKEAALFVRAEQLSEVLSGLLAERPEDELPLESIRHAMMSVAAGLQAEGGWLLEAARIAQEVEAIRDYIDLRVSHLMRETVQSWAERRLGAPAVSDPRPGLLAGMAAACADTARTRWVATNGKGDLPVLMAESFDRLAELTAGR